MQNYFLAPFGDIRITKRRDSAFAGTPLADRVSDRCGVVGTAAEIAAFL
ncbi:MAG: hypothetical protein ABW022_19725 [Actinoplanes sp.]